MKTAATVAVLLALFAAAAALAWYVWTAVGDVSLSVHGVIALILGGLATLALGAGLMFLVFYSARKGYDEEAHRRDR